MSDILTQIVRNQKHEKAVKQFLTSVNVAEEYINYDNFKTFANARNTLKSKLVSASDVKTLNKFIRHWVITKGDVKPQYLRRIQNKVVHYAHKEQNLALRNARLERKKNRKLNLA